MTLTPTNINSMEVFQFYIGIDRGSIHAIQTYPFRNDLLQAYVPRTKMTDHHLRYCALANILLHVQLNVTKPSVIAIYLDSHLVADQMTQMGMHGWKWSTMHHRVVTSHIQQDLKRKKFSVQVYAIPRKQVMWKIFRSQDRPRLL